MAKALRIIAIVLMALTAVITIASGIGTRCAAWGTPEELAEWGMTELLPHQGQYQLFVYLTVLAGIVQAVFFVGLVIGKKWGYIGGLIALIAGIIVAAIHVATSRSLRGSSMPNDVRLYASILTLIVMLALRLPGRSPHYHSALVAHLERGWSISQHRGSQQSRPCQRQSSSSSEQRHAQDVGPVVSADDVRRLYPCRGGGECQPRQHQ